MPAQPSTYSREVCRQAFTLADGSRVYSGASGELWRWEPGQRTVADSDHALEYLREHGVRLDKFDAYWLDVLVKPRRFENNAGEKGLRLYHEAKGDAA